MLLVVFTLHGPKVLRLLPIVKVLSERRLAIRFKPTLTDVWLVF